MFLSQRLDLAFRCVEEIDVLETGEEIGCGREVGLRECEKLPFVFLVTVDEGNVGI